VINLDTNKQDQKNKVTCCGHTPKRTWMIDIIKCKYGSNTF